MYGPGERCCKHTSYLHLGAKIMLDHSPIPSMRRLFAQYGAGVLPANGGQPPIARPIHGHYHPAVIAVTSRDHQAGPAATLQPWWIGIIRKNCISHVNSMCHIHPLHLCIIIHFALIVRRTSWWIIPYYSVRFGYTFIFEDTFSFYVTLGMRVMEKWWCPYETLKIPEKNG